jgi:hypothetical protein
MHRIICSAAHRYVFCFFETSHTADSQPPSFGIVRASSGCEAIATCAAATFGALRLLFSPPPPEGCRCLNPTFLWFSFEMNFPPGGCRLLDRTTKTYSPYLLVYGNVEGKFPNYDPRRYSTDLVEGLTETQFCAPRSSPVR